ncbi:hypothetical protein [Pseudomonas sp. Irchel 3E13]|uniref:hypothetical protein n=1 Tax=Pseudomonas sp. Irchel 3E13 TaxID=2008975 RepID=UPI000BA481B8|nr:hypothetical protein [Pseudomonas sp. Irchel 3E13]
MLMQTREFRPVGELANCHPVIFEVSPLFLHVKIGRIGQPYAKMTVKLSDLRFEEAAMTFDKLRGVNVTGGSDSDLAWKIALKPEDAEDLKTLISEILGAAKSLIQAPPDTPGIHPGKEPHP